MIKKLLFLFLGIFLHLCLFSQNNWRPMKASPPMPQNFVRIPAYSFGKTILEDIDNDGDQDAILTGDSAATGFPNVYKNNGMGNFSSFDTLNSLPFPIDDIAMNDIDSDNDFDLIVAGNGVTQVYLNNGSGNFTQTTAYNFINVRDASFEFFDFDRDGDDDFIISGRVNAQNQNYTILYRKTSSTSFVAVANTPFTPVHSGNIKTADLDGDFDVDIILTGVNSANNPIAEVYKNNGLGSYSLATPATAIPALWNAELEIGDIDNDNDIDLFVCGRTSLGGMLQRHIYINNGSGFFSNSISTNYDAFNSGEFKLFDADSDGDLDLFVTGKSISNRPTTALYINTNGFFFKLTSSAITEVMHSSFDFGDVNGDSAVDILVGGIDANGIRRTELYLNGGFGNFIQAVPFSFPQLVSGKIYAEDIDGNLANDIIFFGMGGPLTLFKSEIFINDYFGNYAIVNNSNLQAYSNFDADFGDVDGDGDLDFVISGIERGQTIQTRTSLYLNDGVGNFTRSTQSFLAYQNKYSVQLVDYDNDQDLDLFLHGTMSGNFRSIIYSNDGSGNFSAISAGPFSNLRVNNPVFIDIDNDQDLDFFYVGIAQNGGFLVENTGGPWNLSSPRAIPNGTNFQFLTETQVIDINQDGFQDFVVSGQRTTNGPSFVNFLLNDGFNRFRIHADYTIPYPLLDVMEFSDIDLDGDIDIMVIDLNQNSNHPILYLNNGKLGFSPDTLNSINASFRGALKLFDANRDSFPDLVMLGTQNGTQGLINMNCIIPTSNMRNDTLTANYKNASYQWLDCNNNYAPISGATNEVFIATNPGSYAVAITALGCTDTTQCKTASLVGLNEHNSNEVISLNPNPSTGNLNIEFAETEDFIELEILNLKGQALSQSSFHKTQTINLNLDLSEGIYLLSIQLKKERIIKKIVIQ